MGCKRGSLNEGCIDPAPGKKNSIMRVVSSSWDPYSAGQATKLLLFIRITLCELPSLMRFTLSRWYL